MGNNNAKIVRSIVLSRLVRSNGFINFFIKILIINNHVYSFLFRVKLGEGICDDNLQGSRKNYQATGSIYIC